MLAKIKIAIKTKNRVEKLRKKTYSSIIQKYGFDESKVHLFVSDDKDLKEYSKAYPKCKVIKGPSGIAAIDNFIVQYFNEGEVYLYMNDDVSGIYEVVDKKNMKEVEDLKSLLNKLIKECKKNNFTYGGFYPVCNPFYMHGQKPIRHDLSLVMDPVSICINNKDVKLTEIKVPKPDGTTFIGESSDAEKCIQHYMSRGGIVRFNRYSPKVEYYGKEGGYQGRDAFTEKYTAEFLMNKYPDYVSGVRFKKDGKTSIRLIKNPKVNINGGGNIRKFVISMDNKIGVERRSKLNYDYELFNGVWGKDCPEWIKRKMKHRTNIGEKAKLGKLGCWASYAKLLQKIIDEKINNVLILEDDLIQVRKFNIEDLGDQPIYLNGWFHHPTNYTLKNSEWVKKVKKELNLKNGINKIDFNKIRIVGTWGVFIPKWQQAEEILNGLKKAKRYTTVDSQLSKTKLIKNFYWPARFKHHDNNISSISSKGWGGEDGIEYWNKREREL